MTVKQKAKIKELKKLNEELLKFIGKIKNAVKCPFCYSLMSIKVGFRNTKKGKIQRFKCLNCNKRFMIRDLSFRQRNKSEMIEKALILNKKGLSTRQIAKKLNTKISHKTVWEWVKKFN